MAPTDIIGIGIGVGIAAGIVVLGVIAALQAWNYLPVKEPKLIGEDPNAFLKWLRGEGDHD